VLGTGCGQHEREREREREREPGLIGKQKKTERADGRARGKKICCSPCLG
jgi:hypothetical protein